METNIEAIEFLKYLQEKHIQINKKTIRKFNSKDFFNYIKLELENNPNKDILFNALKSVGDKKSNIVLQTEYEDYACYNILFDVSNSIENIKDNVLKYQKIKQQPDRRLFFGIVQCDFLCAEIHYINNEVLIVLTSGFFHFAFRLAEILSLIFPLCREIDELQGEFSVETKDIIAELNRNANIKTMFCDLMLTCLFNDDPAKSIGIKLLPHKQLFSGIIHSSFISFIYAHEYSHYLLGHFNKIKDRYCGNTIFDSNGWEEEYSADILGVLLTLAANNENNTSYITNIIGIILCLKCFEFLDKLDCLRSDNKFGNKGTHPPATARLQRIIDFIDNQLSHSNEEIFPLLIDILDYLWDNFEMYFKSIQQYYNETDRNILDQDLDYVQDLMFGLTTSDNT